MTVDTTITPATPNQTMAQLMQFEGRKLLTSPLFLIGLALPALGSLVFFLQALNDPSATWVVDGWTIFVGFVLAAIFTMVAVNRAALRDDREHAREQHDALPVGAETRMLAMVSATLWPATVLVVLLGGVTGFAATQVEIVWPITVLRILQIGALVLLYGALGVAGAVWLRNAFMIPMIGIAFYFMHPSDEILASWHAIWPFATPGTPVMAGWHLVYLFGLTLAFTVAAVARTGRGRAVVIAAIAAMTMIGASLTVLLNCPVSTCLV